MSSAQIECVFMAVRGRPRTAPARPEDVIASPLRIDNADLPRLAECLDCVGVTVVAVAVLDVIPRHGPSRPGILLVPSRLTTILIGNGSAPARAALMIRPELAAAAQRAVNVAALAKPLTAAR